MAGATLSGVSNLSEFLKEISTNIRIDDNGFWLRNDISGPKAQSMVEEYYTNSNLEEENVIKIDVNEYYLQDRDVLPRWLQHLPNWCHIKVFISLKIN